MTTPAPPGTPVLAVPATDVTSSSLRSTWTATADTTDYLVQRRTGGRAFATVATVAAPTVTYLHSGLSGGFIYDVRIIARNGTVEGLPSNVVSTMTLFQVRFGHSWTNPDTGIAYTAGQYADFSEGLAKRLAFNGIAQIITTPGVDLIPPGGVDDVELGQVLQFYERRVPRDGAAPGYAVILDGDGKTLILAPNLNSGAGGSGAVPAATGSVRGTVKLTGDLSGTADAPTVPGLASKLDLEQMQDAVASMLVAGANVTKTYDDATGTLTIAATGTGGGLDAEAVRDTIAAALVAGAGITVVHDDALNTITIAALPVSTPLDVEGVRDTIASALVAGSNITITPNDAADTITISASGLSGGSPSPDVVDVCSTT